MVVASVFLLFPITAFVQDALEASWKRLPRGGYCLAEPDQDVQITDGVPGALVLHFHASHHPEAYLPRPAAPPRAAQSLGWYNFRRRHISLGYLSPLNFERSHDALFDVVGDADQHVEATPETWQSSLYPSKEMGQLQQLTCPFTTCRA